MKYLYFLVLLLLLTVETSAQTSSNSSELSVLKKKWSMRLRTNLSDRLNAELNADPFRANQEVNQANKDQKEYLREREIRQKSGQPLPTPKVRVKPIESGYKDFVPTKYAYQIKVKNNGTKIIQKVVWEYIFLDLNTSQEVGRFEFTSETSLKPQETDTLAEEIMSPPTGSINVNDAGKKSSELYIEQVNIKSIQYTDGSIWQANLN